MAEELERQEADRKLQAEKLKNKLEVGNWALPFLADFFKKAESTHVVHRRTRKSRKTGL